MARPDLPHEVREAVLARGEPFRGEADILGVPYFTAYDPIMDADGKVMIFVRAKNTLNGKRRGYRSALSSGPKI